MKGLSTIKNTIQKRQSLGLTNIDRSREINNLRSLYSSGEEMLRDKKVAYPCAYHVGEKITNFCININCLLPLCPKCIKVHSEEHQRMGVYANYPTIQQCLQQCKQIQSNSINRLEELSQVCQEMALLHNQHILESKQQLSKAKQEMVEYIDGIFKFYQYETQKIIEESASNYHNQLILFHKQIMTLMAHEKQLQNKYKNQNLRMQFLIDFHSKPDITALLNQHATTIDSFKPNYLQLSINTYELERIKVIIKKYLDFGVFNNAVQQNLQSNPHYKKITISPVFSYTNTKSYTDQERTQYGTTTNQKQFIRSPIKNLWKTENQIIQGMQTSTKKQTTKKNIYAFQYDQVQGSNLTGIEDRIVSGSIRQKIQKNSKLQNFQSPLQAYSLQKSRKQRY